MDIGDPSEIPSTRKRLPSMQELGAFDLTAPPPAAPAARPTAQAVAVAASVSALPANASPAPAPSPSPAPRQTPTSEQLRQALAKADPETRQKLLRLISGGKSVQQVGSAATGGARRRSLVMQADPVPRRTPEASAAPKSPAWQAARPTTPPPPPRSASARSSAEQPLLHIDANTELLDVAAPPRSAAERKADLQAQLDQVQQQAAAPSDKATAETLAHKVLFPAYDPERHGDDVHGASRRRAEGPIEGHFPAPRQPFQATYRHPDGRPMTPEENQVEEVLQAQRCEETLTVLARDGVNGLLLSPRDLDAAVAQGLLTSETAATLWKTWAALRPVIHVIEDEPAEPTVAQQTDDPGASEAAGDAAMPALTSPAEPPDPVPVAATTEPPSPPPPPVPATITASTSAPPRAPTRDPELEAPTLPLPRAAAVAPETPVAPDGSASAPPSPRRLRLRAMARMLGWVFIAYCVLATSTRLTLAAWHQWGHLWPFNR